MNRLSLALVLLALAASVGLAVFHKDRREKP